MSELAQRLRTVHTHVERLLRGHAELSTTVSRLEADLRDQHRASDVLNARIAELERENEVLRAERATPQVTERTGTKERIDELVGEIDRCLSLLQN